MKIVCVKQGSNITIGKVYENLLTNVILSKLNYYIINDVGDKALYDNRNFITLEEQREQKLKELGI